MCWFASTDPTTSTATSRRCTGFTAAAMSWVMVAWEDAICKGIALGGECSVAAVEYRLAPEHPHPAPVEDCYAGFTWLASNAAHIGVDDARIAVGGSSAGGGLAASLTLLARDRGEMDIAWQMLIYPMLDDQNTTRSSRYVTHPKVWNREANLAGWNALLEGNAGGPDVSPYAAAARAEDLSGLPPAYIAVGELDLFLDEDIEFAQRLLAAGVPTELHVYPKAYHGSDLLAATTETSQRWIADRDEAPQAVTARLGNAPPRFAATPRWVPSCRCDRC